MSEISLDLFLFKYGGNSIHIAFAEDALRHVYLEAPSQHFGPIGVLDGFLAFILPSIFKLEAFLFRVIEGFP